MGYANLSFIVPVNKEDVLKRNILRSKVYRDGKHEFIIQTGYDNVPRAYNDAVAKATNELLVFCHQDVFFPDSWEDEFFAQLAKVEEKDPDWGVLGSYGVQAAIRFWTRKRGITYVGDHRLTVAGGRFVIDDRFPKDLPREVETLDEEILIVRKQYAVFDEDIPNNHFYGADLCLRATAEGRKSYAISAYLHHNMTSTWIKEDFYVAGRYMYDKFNRKLPISTTCVIIEDDNGNPMFRTDFIAISLLTLRSIWARLSRKRRPLYDA
jgi:hypothetical protein